MNHFTEGKWLASPGTFVLGEDGKAICQVNYGRPDAECFANRDRIVACVNACEGIPSEVLRAYTVLEKLRENDAQRNALLAALELCAGWVEAYGQPEIREQVRAAITGVKGSAAAPAAKETM